jgi:hypothetical protein
MASNAGSGTPTGMSSRLFHPPYFAHYQPFHLTGLVFAQSGADAIAT